VASVVTDIWENNIKNLKKNNKIWGFFKSFSLPPPCLGHYFFHGMGRKEVPFSKHLAAVFFEKLFLQIFRYPKRSARLESSSKV